MKGQEREGKRYGEGEHVLPYDLEGSEPGNLSQNDKVLERRKD